MNVLIIGRGRVGNGLRRALDPTEHEVEAVGRRWTRAAVRAADVILITVPDDAIESVSERVSTNVRPGTAVLHCAGASGTGVLRACEAQGAEVGVMHPLVSFASKRNAPGLAGTTFAANGTRGAISTSRRIASACGARVVVAQTGDPAYHAAAALAANGAAALAFVSVSVLKRLGFGKRAAERAVGGLLQTVGENVQMLGVPDALTGPIARGELATVVQHRAALARVSRTALSAYDAAVPVIVECARTAGLAHATARRMLRAIER